MNKLNCLIQQKTTSLYENCDTTWILRKPLPPLWAYSDERGIWAAFDYRASTGYDCISDEELQVMATGIFLGENEEKARSFLENLN